MSDNEEEIRDAAMCVGWDAGVTAERERLREKVNAMLETARDRAQYGKAEGFGEVLALLGSGS